MWDILYLRRPVLNYVSPPVCEVIFSGSSSPVIILSTPVIGRVTGLAIGGFGGFQLTWNVFPGALCYNIYHTATGSDVAVILAQCVTDPTYPLPPDLGPGEVTVTPVTEDGEGPPSDPVPYPTGPSGGTDSVFVLTECPSASRIGFPGSFTLHRDFTTGSLTVHYTMSGTAVNGIDYEPLSGNATFPNGVNEITIEVVPIEVSLNGDKTAILTIDEAPNYFVSEPREATVFIRDVYLRIKDYGTLAVPLFESTNTNAPSPAAASAGCEWDGTFNKLTTFDPTPGPEFVYDYQDTDGNSTYPPGINESIQGHQVGQISLAGPYLPAGSPLVRWQVQITGVRQDGNIYVIWQGYKTQAQGGDADGVYQIAGSFMADLRPTVEFEFF